MASSSGDPPGPPGASVPELPGGGVLRSGRGVGRTTGPEERPHHDLTPGTVSAPSAPASDGHGGGTGADGAGQASGTPAVAPSHQAAPADIRQVPELYFGVGATTVDDIRQAGGVHPGAAPQPAAPKLPPPDDGTGGGYASALGAIGAHEVDQRLTVVDDRALHDPGHGLLDPAHPTHDPIGGHEPIHDPAHDPNHDPGADTTADHHSADTRAGG